MTKPFAIVMALGLLAACSQAAETPTTDRVLQALDLREERGQLQDIRFVQLAQAGAPQLKFGIEDLDIVTLAVPDTTRDGIQTWLALSGYSFSLEDGFLRATRGFGDDLMSTDVSQTIRAVLGKKTTTVTRRMAFIGAEDQIETRQFTCDIANRGARSLTVNGKDVPTTLMAENCTGNDQTFENLYWLRKSNGKMVQSRQWGSDLLGPIVMRDGPVP